MKARLLVKLTHIIYGYNQSIVKWEQEQDEYRKKQLEREIQEIHDKINRVITDELAGKETEFAP
jgi:ribosome recycling factor